MTEAANDRPVTDLEHLAGAWLGARIIELELPNGADSATKHKARVRANACLVAFTNAEATSADDLLIKLEAVFTCGHYFRDSVDCPSDGSWWSPVPDLMVSILKDVESWAGRESDFPFPPDHDRIDQRNGHRDRRKTPCGCSRTPRAK